MRLLLIFISLAVAWVLLSFGIAYALGKFFRVGLEGSIRS